MLVTRISITGGLCWFDGWCSLGRTQLYLCDHLQVSCVQNQYNQVYIGLLQGYWGAFHCNNRDFGRRCRDHWYARHAASAAANGFIHRGDWPASQLQLQAVPSCTGRTTSPSCSLSSHPPLAPSCDCWMPKPRTTSASGPCATASRPTKHAPIHPASPPACGAATFPTPSVGTVQRNHSLSSSSHHRGGGWL